MYAAVFYSGYTGGGGEGGRHGRLGDALLHDCPFAKSMRPPSSDLYVPTVPAPPKLNVSVVPGPATPYAGLQDCASFVALTTTPPSATVIPAGAFSTGAGAISVRSSPPS